MACNEYTPLRDYGAIGNLRTTLVIGRDASLDWCCLPHLDSPSVFSALLDRHKGGRFRVGLAGADLGSQRYLEDTNVLVTEFQTEGAWLQVTDFMPLSGNIESLNHSKAPPELHRVLAFRGSGTIEVEWSPRFDYARSLPRIERKDEGWLARDGQGNRLVLAGMPEGDVVDTGQGLELTARIRFNGEGRRLLVTRWDGEDASIDPEASQRMLDETCAVWRRWVHREKATRSHEWAGDWIDLVKRSELALKMLTHAETGAIAAAATTSLPETLGGVRNWDYRYAWIRDASLTGQALTSLGHDESACELLHWMEGVTAAQYEQDWKLQIMYGIHGQVDLEEFDLDHLEGYCRSRPVRIGNKAAEQFQLEIFGEVLTSAYELARRGLNFKDSIEGFLTKVANHVQEVWKEPDYGIWEVRGDPRHYTYSKVMAWVALDRAIHLAAEYGLEGDIESWKRSRSEIRAAVLEHGYSERVGSFVMAFDWDDLDAANLRIPLVEFLPCDDPRVRNTIDRTRERLAENGLVYRYLVDDGLPGKEGAFGLCSFWLVDTLALSGRVEEAEEVLESVAGHANHLGLFSEQIDPASGAFLGNFPQAFTHIGLVNSVLYLAHAQGKPTPETALIGTAEHRRQVSPQREA